MLHIPHNKHAIRSVLLISILVLLFVTNVSATSWFDDDWGYRKQITISNTGDIITNYQVELFLNSSTGSDSENRIYLDGLSQSDYDDIRFTNETGVDKLDYWIEEYNSTVSTVWVEVDYIDNTTPKYIYIYYGNPRASSESKCYTTFPVGDDFNDGIINTTTWNVITRIAGSTITELPSGVLEIYTPTTADSMAVITSKTTIGTGYSLSVKYNHTNIPSYFTNKYTNIGFGSYLESATQFQLYQYTSGDDSLTLIDDVNDASMLYHAGITKNAAKGIYDISPGQSLSSISKVYEIYRYNNGTIVKWFVDDVPVYTETSNTVTESIQVVIGDDAHKTTASNAYSRAYCDYAFVRKVVDISPTISSVGNLEINLSANFESSSTTGYTPFVVTYNDTSLWSPTSWYWDIDNDGNVDYITQNCSHMYTTSGIYSVNFTISNATTTATRIVSNCITSIHNDADFTANNTVGYSPMTVNFTDISVGVITNWSWDFDNNGDVDSYEQNPIYTYNHWGTYIVNLTISNEYETSTEIKYDYVTVYNNPPISNFTLGGDAYGYSDTFYTASVSITPPLFNTTITFNGSDEYNITVWNWSFGDGTYADTQNTTKLYTYENFGLYTINLTVINETGINFTLKTLNVTPYYSWIDGDYIVSKFNSTGITSWKSPTGGKTARYLVIAGGGGGGGLTSGYGGSGGGGAGGLLTGYIDVNSVVNVGVGMGGLLELIGYSSNFSYINTTGGGRGGGYYSGLYNSKGENGGSGGGSRNGAACGTGIEGQGNRGGIGSTGSPYTGGGGGGAGYPGNNRTVGNGTGGWGIVSTITGSSIWYAGGGGGSCYTSCTPSPGGLGGGGGSAATPVEGTNGLGGGGGAKVGNGYGARGGSGVVILRYTSYDYPVSNFTANVTMGCAALGVGFTDYSWNTPTSYYWDIDNDGSVDYTTRNCSHSYTVPGIYSVNLTTSNEYGTNTTIRTNYITVNGTKANFTTNVTSGYAPLKVSFTDTSLCNPTSWYWDVDNDGSVDYTTQTCEHTYTLPGNYTVNLTVTNPYSGNTTIKTNYITATGSVTNYTVDYHEGAYSSLTTSPTFTFTDLTLGSPTNWSWDFDDGTTSNDQNPTHQFATTGIYEVNLNTSIPGVWYNDSTLHHITVNHFNYNVSRYINGTNGNLYNYQVPYYLWNISGINNGANVYLGDGTTRTDWSDVRFTSPSGICYDYWIESTNATSAKMWVEIPFIQMGIFNLTEVRLFYGNSSVLTNSSNGDNTFRFFDHFENPTTSLNTTKWTLDFTSGTATLTIANSTFSIISVSTGYRGVKTTTTFTSPYRIVGRNVIPVDTTTFFGAFTSGNTNPTTTAQGIAVFYNKGGSDITREATGSAYSEDNVDWDNNNYCNFEILRFSNGTQDFYVNDSIIDNDHDRAYTSPTILRIVGYTNTAYPVVSDWVFVSNYTYPEPLYYEDSLPISNFTSNVTMGCCPLSVMFNDTTTNSPTNWSWDVDNDGNVDYTTQNCTHTYSGSGLYSVNLTTSNEEGSNTTIKVNYINVTGVTAEFSANVTFGANPLVVQFYDNSTCNPDHWNWDVNGDDVVDYTTQNPTHIYSTPGTYTVKLYAYNDYSGSWLNATSYITACELPVANFTSNATSGVAPATVMFNDTTSASPTEWHWDVDGDGTFDYNTQNITHTYTLEGTYTVKLYVNNTCGSSWSNKTDYITMGEIPSAAFSSDVTIGARPLSVSFTDSSTGTAPLSYAWDVNGDGSFDYYTQNPSHVYSSTGIYNVNLRVTNIYGVDWENKTSYIDVGDAPIAAFSADDILGAAPHTVVFTGSATGTTPINYYWDVTGDGTFDYFVQSPTHVYSTAGIYTVNLYVNSSYGSDWENKTSYITVGNAPSANFTGNPLIGTPSTTVTFTDSSTGDLPLSYAWDVNNDGAFDYYTQNPSHTYSGVGVYTVKQRVTNAFGVSWMNRTNYVNIGNSPGASFVGAPRSSDTVPIMVTFNDTSTNTPTSWAWDVDDDGVVDYTTRNCTHAYTISGKYTVNLTVSNIYGTTFDREVDYIRAGIPVANFYADPRWSEHDPLEVTFTDISTNTPISWQWDFGDGTTSTEQNPTHEYTRAGTYSVVLTAENAVGDDIENKVAYVSVGELSPITPYDMIPVTPRPTTTFGVYATTLIESNYNVTTFGEVLPKAFTDIIDSDIAPQIFWGIVFAFVFIALFMRVGDVPLLVLFGLVAAGTILAFIPGEWQAIAQAFLVVGLAAIFYMLIKGRFR